MFCSRELESGLTEYVRREVGKTGVFPSDESLRERARQIMAMQKTSCDDPVLLERFKASVKATLLPDTGTLDAVPEAGPAGPLTPGLAADIATVTGTSSGTGVSDPALMTLSGEMDVDFHFTEQEMNDLLQDMSPDFGGGALLNPSPASNSSTGASGSGVRQ